MSLAALPDQILHLIRYYITPNQSTFNDDEKDQSSPLYRPIISFSLFADFLTRISSAHTSLTDCCTRWDLLPHTLTVLLDREGREEKKLEEGLMETGILAEQTLDEKMLDVCPNYTEEPALPQTWSVDDDIEGAAQELVVGGDQDDHVDLVDEDENEEEDSDWSERDYEEDSEDSNWDSEDDSDYEDDWEAEYGFNLSKTEPVKQLPVPSSTLLAPGRSLLDF